MNEQSQYLWPTLTMLGNEHKSLVDPDYQHTLNLRDTGIINQWLRRLLSASQLKESGIDI